MASFNSYKHVFTPLKVGHTTFKNRVEFSPRERKMVEMLAEGKSNAVIGKELGLSTGTIKNIISDMLKRYRFKNRAQLVNTLVS
jgi:DNA-binding NarL/FixJ family response regulator